MSLTLAQKIDEFLQNENPDVPLHMFKSTIESWKDDIMSSTLLSRTTNLTSAQILALNTTPVSIVPAPGAGKCIQVFGVSAKLKFGTTPYTIGSSGQPGYDYEGGDPGGRGSLMGTPTITANADHVDCDIGIWSVYDSRATIENKALMFSVTNANPAGGNGTLQVTVWYTVDDLP